MKGGGGSTGKGQSAAAQTLACLLVMDSAFESAQSNQENARLFCTGHSAYFRGSTIGVTASLAA